MKALTTVEVTKKLINTSRISSHDKKPNRAVWTSRLIDQLRNIVTQKHIPKNREFILPYKTTCINNRRYLGNKYKLLPFIKKKKKSSIITAAILIRLRTYLLEPKP